MRVAWWPCGLTTPTPVTATPGGREAPLWMEKEERGRVDVFI
jgi:hypothetical protein